MIRIIEPVEKYIVSGITEKTYRLVNLKAKEFQFRVRAEKDEAFSQWSEYNTIKIDDSNGMTNNFFNDNKNPKIYT
jgi:hypothetical protein